MFDSDLDQNARKIQRRTFLTLSVGAIAGIALSHLRRPTVLAAAAPAGAGCRPGAGSCLADLTSRRPGSEPGVHSNQAAGELVVTFPDFWQRI